ncbi:MAG: alpha/beta fold hydrolase [Sphingobacteriales bacterium]|nr:MAG: alpha/beta fold hydrolase [Sphingobacteriales bacterium]
MNLYYKKIGDGNKNLIILHGLLGSSDNWQTIAKNIKPQYSIYLIDQRNHGRSPHTENMNYQLMADDVFDFLAQQNINKTSILGHSMGGKVAMQFALTYPDFVEQLIVVDIAPKKYRGGHEYILNAMQNAPLHTSTDRNAIEYFLEDKIINTAERQFILKNLTRDEHKNFIWKCNLEGIVKNYNELMDFSETTNQFLGNTFFIRGEKSKYIKDTDYKKIETLFPKTTFITIINATHWVHADNPTQFLEEINKIL